MVAATDYVAAWPQLIAPYVEAAPFTTLGTDGFGRSDTRTALRRFFEVDRHQIVRRRARALLRRGEVGAAIVEGRAAAAMASRPTLRRHGSAEAKRDPREASQPQSFHHGFLYGTTVCWSPP